MVTKTFNLFFWLKKPKNYKSGPLPIYLRITVNGKRTEYSIQRSCEKSKWNVATGRATGNNETARTLNAYLEAIQRKVYYAQQALIDAREEISANSIKNKLLGITPQTRMILEVFRQQNAEMKEPIGNGYAPLTHTRYQTTFEHTRLFIKWKYHKEDMEIEKLNYSFLTNFDFYLRTEKKCSHNTTMKYLTNFKKVVLLCVKKDWLAKDPFIGFNFSFKEIEKPYLNQKELDTLSAKQSQHPDSILSVIFFYLAAIPRLLMEVGILLLLRTLRQEKFHLVRPIMWTVFPQMSMSQKIWIIILQLHFYFFNLMIKPMVYICFQNGETKLLKLKTKHWFQATQEKHRGRELLLK